MICFIAWNTSIAGGVQNLIINITEHLASINDRASIIGYQSSFIVSELKRRNVQYEFLDIENSSIEKIKVFLNNKVVVFTSFSPNLNLYKLKKANPKVLYWNVFPTGLKEANKFGVIDLTFLSKKLANYLIESNGCVFMDKHGFDATVENSKILLHSNINYLPIPVKIPKGNTFVNRLVSRKSTELNISYVGRGSIWKIVPFIKFIKDLLEVDLKGLKVTIHIITQEVEKYKHHISEDISLSKYDIFYIDNLFGESYINYLKNNIDLHVAMGTAALDGASLGIPTIVMDYAAKAMPQNYKYRWIYLTKNYDLGHDAWQGSIESDMCLTAITKAFTEKDIEQLVTISGNCYSYVQSNHSVKSVSNKLVDYSAITKARAVTVLNLTIANNFIFRLIIGRLLRINPKRYDV